MIHDQMREIMPSDKRTTGQRGDIVKKGHLGAIPVDTGRV